MKSIFAYDSKFMQVLLVVADYLILNFLFVLCCLPIFTIGAAQAGLYTGIKVLQDKEDDSSCAKAFFRGFASGFGTITVGWVLTTVIMVVLGYNLALVLFYQYAGLYAPEFLATLPLYVGEQAPLVLSCIAVAIIMIFQSVLTIFHASFGCKLGQLFKNTFLMILAHPLRCLTVTLLTWLPVIFLILYPPFFLQASIAWFAIYYSVAFRINYKTMQKPFLVITQNFVEAYEAEHGEILLEEAEK